MPVVWCELRVPFPSHSLWIRSKVHQTRVHTTGYYWYWYTECSRTHLNALPAMMRQTLTGKTAEMHHWSVLATTTNPGEPAPEQSADLDFRVGQERLCSPSHPMPILSSSPLASWHASRQYFRNCTLKDKQWPRDAYWHGSFRYLGPKL